MCPDLRRHIQFSTLMPCNFVCECADDLKILHKSVTAFKNKNIKILELQLIVSVSYCSPKS